MTDKELENCYLELHATVSLFWGVVRPDEMNKELGYLKELHRLAQLGKAMEDEEPDPTPKGWVVP